FHAENDLRMLPWPVQSPDLNPIENPRDETKKNHTTLLNLTDRSKNHEDTIENLVNSMPQRIQAVIATKRGTIT
ncbi:12353_t:CDS:1, partial [Ambispora gerdemannii]